MSMNAEDMHIREYREDDVADMARIWNEVVADGEAFPQEEPLGSDEAAGFFAAQTYCAVAETADGQIMGMYILHPNNVGRCGHICNASYAVSSTARGRHVGEKLVLDCMEQGREHGFRILQFNAVVADNVHARHLYERLGFTLLGTVPGGFRSDEGYKDICLYYHVL
ncbi:MAG: GNAT family N-acetyltransferase [Bifidobacteriaceae bacterium]|nr:GNAT family N-acetyltransferase [Bifidobacteriaceae bacterium]